MKIARYAIDHFRGKEFDYTELMNYGLDEDQAIEICHELNVNGELDLPEGVEYGSDY